MSFIKDLRFGQKAEDLVISAFERVGWKCEKSKGNAPGWDFLAQKDLKNFTYEVKFDKMSDRTGNLAIEYWNPLKNRESGLTVSKADFWVYCFGIPVEIHMVALKTLLDYINNNEPHKIVDVGGDKNASLLLYRRDEIIKSIFWRIDDLDEISFNIGLSFYLDERSNNFVRKTKSEGKGGTDEFMELV